MKKINIAIDGYTSCGKSTIAKEIAAHLGYAFVDTGAMYRAVTLFAMEQNLIDDYQVKKEELISKLPGVEVVFQHNATSGNSETFLNGTNVEKDIREMRVSQQVSKIAAIKEVRKKLVEIQKNISANKGVVMDGRDIGTVVIPDAELKLFVTADKAVRAQRRLDELLAKGKNVTLNEVMDNIEKRDYVDTHRKMAPLVQADDAVVIDNTSMTRESQLEYIKSLVKEKMQSLSTA